MTDQKIDPENAARFAREMLEQSTEKRVNAVRAIITATNALDDAEQSVKDARDAHGRVWAYALSTGWSDKDLRATGARPPAKGAAPSRTRRIRRVAASSGEGGA